MRFALLLLLGLAACAAPEAAPPTQAEADRAAAQVVALSTPAVTWEELRIHPVLMQRPCAVHTLVDEDARVVGYCERGQHCRTNDWRPVVDRCTPGGHLMPEPPTTGPAIDLAGRR